MRTQRIESLSTIEQKHAFRQQCNCLPKLGLLSLLNIHQKTDIRLNNHEIPNLEFYIVDVNLILPSYADEIKGTHKNKEVYDELLDFFNTTDLYIVSSNKDSIDIPMHLHEIDYNKVDIDTAQFTIDSLSSNYFNIHKDEKYKLDTLVTRKHDIVYNASELALNVFIGLKQHLV